MRPNACLRQCAFEATAHAS
jgi:hypothetical protein